MKNLFNMLMAVAIAACTFTACEDVPEPYTNPYDQASNNNGGEQKVVIEPAGTGTEADPFNVAAALAKCAEVGETGTAENVYAVGIVTAIKEISAQYGNAEFTISDDAAGSNALTVYRAYGPNNQKITNENLIKVGDKVVICGKLVNFKGNTPEFTQGCYIVSISSGSDTPTPSTDGGTLEKPFTVAQALAKCAEVGETGTPNDVYAVGIVTAITEISTQYGNATFSISDDEKGSNMLTVYRAKGLDNKSITDENIIKVSDKVVICGKLVNFKGNTPEFTQGCYIVSINDNGGNGGGGDTPQPGVTTIGTKDAPVNVARAIADINNLDNGATTSEFYYVKGTIKTIKTKAEDIAKYKNIDYIITDDGNNELTVFRGKNINNTDFTAEGQINVGDVVTVYGQLQKYVNANTGAVVPEIAKDNYIVAKENGGGSAVTPDDPIPGNAGVVSGNTITIDAESFGFADKSPATSVTLSDGTTITFDKNTGSTAPTYYAGTYASVRVYANNTITIAAKKNIKSINITTTDPYQSDKYNGSDGAYAEGGSTKVNINKESDTKVSFTGLNASTVKITNYNEANSKNQLRIRELTITYAE